MGDIQDVDNSNLETPATYRIRVRGHLEDDWSGRLGGMVITRAFTSNKHPLTILVGHMHDQAMLAGVINTLYNLQMPLVSVENIDDCSE